MTGRHPVAGLVLAAGRSTRMGHNKLLAQLAGRPLIAHAVAAALGAGLQPVCVVTGHASDAIHAALRGYAVEFVHNPQHEQGLGSSLAAGIRALGTDSAAAVVLLGDMPRVSAVHVAQLVEAFERSGPSAICVPVHGARRGNPVLWPACDFTALAELSGDSGGRALLDAHAARVIHVAIADDGVLLDADSPQALAEIAARESAS